jgi:hypothetical protein
MTTHECVDEIAREAIRSVRDEHDHNLGRVLREVGKLHEHIDHVRQFIGAPAWAPRESANGHRDLSPSGHDLARFAEEFVTGSGKSHSNPVRAIVEKWTGKLVIRVVLFVAGVAGGLAVEHAIMALVHH